MDSLYIELLLHLWHVKQMYSQTIWSCVYKSQEEEWIFMEIPLWKVLVGTEFRICGLLTQIYFGLLLYLPYRILPFSFGRSLVQTPMEHLSFRRKSRRCLSAAAFREKLMDPFRLKRQFCRLIDFTFKLEPKTPACCEIAVLQRFPILYLGSTRIGSTLWVHLLARS